MFASIAVAGQDSVIADAVNDTLTFVAGSNMTITTNAATDTITFAASGGGASSLTQTFSTTSQSTLDTFALATYGSAEYLIQATRGSDRQLTKLLVVHDSTTAFSTEYGTIITNAELFTTSVAINGSDVEIYVTGTSATSTTYNALYNLVDA